MTDGSHGSKNTQGPCRDNAAIVASVTRATASFADEQGLFQGVGSVSVGFSGGPDSTALLLLLRELAVDLTAVHLHHGIRGEEADTDLAWCRAFCEARDIPFREGRLEVPARRQQGESIEMAARRLRLDYWREHDSPGHAVALGHHLDDKLENLFLRLFRGSNASGLTGLRARRRLAGLLLVRPLLCLRRERIIEYLHAMEVHDYRQDSENAQPQYLRNQVRHRLIPLLHEIAGQQRGAYNTLAYLEEDARVLEELVAESLPAPSEGLPIATLEAVPPALWSRLLHAWLASEMPPRATVIAALREALAKPAATTRIELDRDNFLRLERGHLQVESKAPAPDLPERRWDWRRDPVLALSEIGLQLHARLLPREELGDLARKDRQYWPAAALGDLLLVRGRQPGDRMQPWGRQSPTKLKKLIANARLTIDDKRRLFVVCGEDGEILWAPGVARAAAGEVAADCEEAVELAVTPV